MLTFINKADLTNKQSLIIIIILALKTTYQKRCSDILQAPFKWYLNTDYPTSEPGFTSRSTVMTLSDSSKFTAERIIP